MDDFKGSEYFDYILISNLIDIENLNEIYRRKAKKEALLNK